MAPASFFRVRSSSQLLTLTVAFTILATLVLPSQAPARSPNLILIFIDDLGYADIGPFGATRYATPHLDRMAAEGMRFTNFEVSSAVCSASRAALLTGCYHQRLSVFNALGPNATHGLHPDERTIAEMCREKGYATACFGKWHLGHHPKFLPLNQGFDEYFGLPYSNDMWPYHPDARTGADGKTARRAGYPNLPLIENDRVMDSEVTAEEQSRLTRQYTERAVQFIERNRERPFFLYLPHTMVHVPLFVSPERQGRSGAGTFGDVVQEVDWSVGMILDTLDRLGLTRDSWVVFTSDNGPWLSYGDHAGSAYPLREGKGTSFEGGFRVPTLMRWPGVIPAGTTCDELASTIDILPTMAEAIQASPAPHPIDGHSLLPLMKAEPGAVTPHEYFCYFYATGELQAIRDRRWKLFFPHQSQTLGPGRGGHHGTPAGYTRPQIASPLYDLQRDIRESHDVRALHPDVVERLEQMAEMARAELGDSLTQRKGAGVREHGVLSAGDARLSW